MVRATVREWHDDLGWGVIDRPETPGGCWAQFTAMETPVIGYLDGATVSECRTLSAGDSVELEWRRLVRTASTTGRSQSSEDT